ncbi:hypothetical protein D3C80_1385360 [compost metagenome]
MGGDERLDIRQAVDPGSVFQVGYARVLMTVAKTHQGFVGPGVVVQHRNLDDSRVQGTLGDGLGFSGFHRFKQRMRGDTVRVETNLERRIGQAHIQHAVEGQALHRARHRHAFEEGFQRHAVTDFGKQMFICAKAVTDWGAHALPPLRRSASQVSRVPV